MKIRNAIPPIVLSTLLVSSVYAQENVVKDKSGAYIAPSSDTTKKTEKSIAGSVKKPNKLKSGTISLIQCTNDACSTGNPAVCRVRR